MLEAHVGKVVVPSKCYSPTMKPVPYYLLIPLDEGMADVSLMLQLHYSGLWH